jgi:translation initiation factor IF-3
MDFGKFLYEKTKKEREARRAQTKIEVKEIRLRPKTNVYHQGFKIKDARGWLQLGNKVRVRIRFRGREIDYVDLALTDLKRVAEELADVSSIEQAPVMEGRSVVMVLAPQRRRKSKPTASCRNYPAGQGERPLEVKHLPPSGVCVRRR